MGKWGDALTQGPAAPGPAPPGSPSPSPAPTGKWSGALLGREAFTPQYRTDTQKSASPWDVAIASLAEDPEARARWYATQRGLPLDRYSIRNGAVYFEDDDKHWYRERGDDLLSGAMSGMGEVLPAAGGIVGGLVGVSSGTAAGGPIGGIAGGAAGGGLGAAAGSRLRQILARYIMGQDPEIDRDIREGAFDAVGGLAGDLMARGVNKIAALKAARRYGKNLKKQIDQPLKDALDWLNRETGLDIKLSAAELSINPRLIQEQQVLQGLPAGIEVIVPFKEEQARRAGQAIEMVTGQQFPGMEMSTEAAGRLMRGQARSVIEDMVSARQKQATHLYMDAFTNQRAPVDLTDFLTELERLRAISGKTTKSHLKFVDSLLETVEDAGSLEEIHNKIRTELSDHIFKMTKPYAKKQLTRLLRDYLDPAMDLASPSYADARSLYRDASGALERQLEGMIGGLAETGEANLESIPARLLRKGGPDSLNTVRNAFTRLPGGQEAWDAQLRAYFTETFEEAGRKYMSTASSPSRAAMSTPARFWADVWGSPKQRRRWAAAMTPEQFRAMDQLMKVLEATSKTLYFGSERAERTELAKWLQKGLGSLKSSAIRSINPLNLVDQLADFSLQTAQENNIRRMAQIITDPQSVNLISSSGFMAAKRPIKYAIIGRLLSGVGAEEIYEDFRELEGPRNRASLVP